MGHLFLLTDAFPYGKGEDFISNEIVMLAKAFDKVFIIPSGIMCDIQKVRDVPNNVTILPPVYTRNLYKDGNPTKTQRILWSIQYMLPSILRCFINGLLYKEIKQLIKNNEFSVKKLLRIVRQLSPCLRNISHYKEIINESMFHKETNISYSFWFDYSQIMLQEVMRYNKISVPLKRLSRGHRHDIYVDESPLQYLPFREIYFSYIDNLYISTLDGYEYMKNRYPNYKDKVHLSYLGTKDQGMCCKKIDNVFRIVTCSFASQVKRIDLIIEALSRLTIKREVEWIYFGDGLLYDKLKKLAEDKLRGKIKFVFKGYTPNKKMLEFYKNNSIDVFVNVSTSEGLPVSIQEAISFGIPIIATNVGSTREAVISNYNGFLLDKDFKVDELTKCFEYFSKLNESEFRDYSQNSRKLWEENYNAEVVYPKFINEICKINS